MDTTHWVLAGLLGLSLAASTGLNAFLPLLMLGVAAHFHMAGVKLNEHDAWLSSGSSLLTLGGAAVVEMIGDKIPAVDHALHAVGLLARPAAGALAASSVLAHVDPATAAIAGLILGAPTSLGFHAAASGLRVASTATTMGCANPFLSTLEDFLCVSMVMLGMLLPLLVPVVLVAAIALLWKLSKSARARISPSRSV